MSIVKKDRLPNMFEPVKKQRIFSWRSGLRHKMVYIGDNRKHYVMIGHQTWLSVVHVDGDIWVVKGE